MSYIRSRSLLGSSLRDNHQGGGSSQVCDAMAQKEPEVERKAKDEHKNEPEEDLKAGDGDPPRPGLRPSSAASFSDTPALEGPEPGRNRAFLKPGQPRTCRVRLRLREWDPVEEALEDARAKRAAQRKAAFRQRKAAFRQRMARRTQDRGVQHTIRTTTRTKSNHSFWKTCLGKLGKIGNPPGAITTKHKNR